MPILIILPELRNLLPPLSESEYVGLEKDILERGCLSPLATWNDAIVDGHNRYEICKKHGLPFPTTALEFTTLDEARFWAWQHQENRRNMTAFQRAELALQFKPLLAAKGKEKMSAGGGDQKSSKAKSGCQISDNPIRETVDVKKALAKTAGVSHDTMHKAEFLSEHADDETKDNLRQGKTSINKEYRRVKREIDRDEVIEPLRPNDPNSPLVKKVRRRVNLRHICAHDPEMLIATVQSAFLLVFRQKLIPGLLAKMLERDGEEAFQQTLQTIKTNFSQYF